MSKECPECGARLGDDVVHCTECLRPRVAPCWYCRETGKKIRIEPDGTRSPTDEVCPKCLGQKSFWFSLEIDVDTGRWVEILDGRRQE